jgi:phosphatidylglycerol:prolipoprotein diacylglycerol transferase
VVPVVEVARRLPPRAGRSSRGRSGGVRQVLFEWHGIKIHSYRVMLYLGLSFGMVAGDFMANRAGLPAARVLVAIILLTVTGLLGARLLFVVTHWSVYRREPWRIWRRSEGGAAVQGGLVLAVMVSPPLLTALHLPLGAFWDVTTFVMLIWLIFGRVGCLMHGCCSGRPSSGPFTLELPNQIGVWRRRFPTQLLEAAWALILLFGAIGLSRHAPFPGALFLAAVAAYGMGRMALEPLRERQDRYRAMNIQQCIAAVLIAMALISLVVLWLRQASPA